MKKIIIALALLATISVALFICNLKNIPVSIIKHSPQVPILMYHHLVTAEEIQKNPEYAENGSIISVEKFAEQMKYLHDNGYTTITLQELADFIKGDFELPPKPIVITFDDGYKSNYTLAYPVLKKYNHKATINIVVKSTVEPVPGTLPHLTWEEMREMTESGLISIQSHTFDLHNYLPVNNSGKTKPALTSRIWLAKENRLETPEEYKQRLHNDFLKSKKIIEENLNSRVNVLCFPYGAYNDTALEIAENLGYEIFLTIKKGYNTKNTSLQELYRFGIAEKTPAKEFIAIVTGQ